MRRIAIALVIAVAAPSSAEARVHTIAPPGNSGVGQSVETVPTAGGGQPTNRVHPTGGAVGRPGGPGGTNGNGGAGGSGAVTASTQHALAAQGPTGAAAAALAEATAPQTSRSPSHARGTGPVSAVSAVSAVSTGGESSPATSVFKALSGSTSGGGVGPLLPALLIASVLAAAGLALIRRRRTS